MPLPVVMMQMPRGSVDRDTETLPSEPAEVRTFTMPSVVHIVTASPHESPDMPMASAEMFTCTEALFVAIAGVMPVSTSSLISIRNTSAYGQLTHTLPSADRVSSCGVVFTTGFCLKQKLSCCPLRNNNFTPGSPAHAFTQPASNASREIVKHFVFIVVVFILLID